MERTLIIGDIHGACKGLEQVLERAGLTADDRLIFLGDYVDGWSESKQVIERLMELDEQYRCIFMKGNHDAWCEEWLASGTNPQKWLFHGGNSTVKSYEGITAMAKQKHLEFFNRMRPFYVDENNNLFIHAGFSSMHGPEQENYTSNYSWDRTLWEMALATDPLMAKDSRFYPKRLKLFREIFIGHTPTTNYDVEEPIHAANLWNVDTGAAFMGRVTALDLETKAYWQSDVVQTLYPGEKGRN